VALFVSGEFLQQFKAKLFTEARGGAGVGFVDDDALGSDGEEMFSVSLALDVVEADYSERVLLKETGSGGKGAFDASCAGGSQSDCSDMKAGCEFRLPLVHEVWWAQYGALRDLPSVEELAKDESCFDGFADTDIVGDEQSHHGQPQRHEQWDDLVGARFYGNVSEGTEGAGAVAKFEMNCVAQEGSGLMAAVEFRVR
jgi:hypothetical protein